MINCIFFFDSLGSPGEGCIYMPVNDKEVQILRLRRFGLLDSSTWWRWCSALVGAGERGGGAPPGAARTVCPSGGPGEGGRGPRLGGAGAGDCCTPAGRVRAALHRGEGGWEGSGGAALGPQPWVPPPCRRGPVLPGSERAQPSAGPAGGSQEGTETGLHGVLAVAFGGAVRGENVRVV